MRELREMMCHVIDQTLWHALIQSVSTESAPPEVVVGVEAHVLEYRGLDGGEHLEVSELARAVHVEHQVPDRDVKPLVVKVEACGPRQTLRDVLLDVPWERMEQFHPGAGQGRANSRVAGLCCHTRVSGDKGNGETLFYYENKFGM